MDQEISNESIVWGVVEGGQSRFMRHVPERERTPETENSATNRRRFVEREGIKSSAVLVLKAGESREIVGLRFANYRDEHDFGTEERRAMETLASSAAIAIRTVRLYERVKDDLNRLKSELGALHAIDQAIVSAASPPKVDDIGSPAVVSSIARLSNFSSLGSPSSTLLRPPPTC